ncbi:hypothetical protein SCMU_14240 [Sinomonas cyclohexanicum]|uniref:DUF1922 domain-containing protein n=1 Tax=Sinomonas cyclohexanicum TaxID=322009 RepID=A0ABM7PTX4_SINCY|nr:hypothetical protein [Corynebacterium cyclohexanicum]BCT75582.1 hypothetical protein SCMU_14240 [Corynebacterium cyclohexanicum]
MGICGVDGEPVTDAGAICHGCAARLGYTLRDIRGLARELDVTITRRSRVASRPGPGAAEVDPVRLDYDTRASAALHELTGALRSWAVNLADDTHTPPPPTTAPVGAVAGWLADRVRHVRLMGWAVDMHHEVTDTVQRARRAIDAPPELAFMGHCPAQIGDGVCGAELWAPSRATDRRCRQCGHTIDLTALRASYLEDAAHIHAPAPVIARALTSHGAPLRADRIYLWRRRGVIAPVGKDPRTGADLYRLGTVAEVLARMDAATPRGVLGRKGKR